jgi:hypothetical protein
LLGATAVVASASCSSSSSGNTLPGAGGAGGTGFGGSGGTFINTEGGNIAGIGGILNDTPPCNAQGPQADSDGDGFTVAMGDCNDCTQQMNPGSFDYPGNGVDEDCNGAPDDEVIGCDNPVDIGYGDPFEGARAIGLCRQQTAQSWGLMNAAYVKADGTPGMADLGHGILPLFGPNVTPREGNRMLALSSGTARTPGDPGWQSPNGADMLTESLQPPGFPVPAPACPQVVPSGNQAFDPAALELTIRVPSNANAFQFDFTFYTYEFPIYICSQFNDFFVAIVSPPPANAQSGNVSFDSQGNPVSVNNGFLEVCPAQNAGGKDFPCPQGTAMLQNTGFDEILNNGPHAATGWLVTTAPVEPGSDITVRFAIWDAGDHILDSTVLIDHFTWTVAEGEFPVTIPVPK